MTSIASAALPAVGSYFQNQTAMKNAMARAGSGIIPPGLNYPGLGYGSAGPGGSGQVTSAVPANYVYMGPQGLGIGTGDVGGGAVPGGAVGFPGTGASGSWMPAAGGAHFHQSAAPSTRADRLIIEANPVNGKLHVWYHVGGLDKIIREGLRACGYGHKRRRYGRRRPY